MGSPEVYEVAGAYGDTSSASEFARKYHPAVAAALYWGSQSEDWLEKSLLAGLMRLEALGCVRLMQDEGGATVVEFLGESAAKDKLDRETYHFLKSFKTDGRAALKLGEVASFADHFPEAFEKRAGLWRKAVLATSQYQACYMPAPREEKTKPAGSNVAPACLLIVAAVVLVNNLAGLLTLPLPLGLALGAIAFGLWKKGSATSQQIPTSGDEYVNAEREEFLAGCERFKAWCAGSQAWGELERMGDDERAAICAMTVALGCSVEAPEDFEYDPAYDHGYRGRHFDDRDGIDWFDVWFAMNAIDMAQHMFGGHMHAGMDAIGGMGAFAGGAAAEEATSGGFAESVSEQASGGFGSADFEPLSGGFGGGQAESGGFSGGSDFGFDREQVSGGFSGGQSESGGFGGGDNNSGRDAMFAGGLFGSMFGASMFGEDQAAEEPQVEAEPGAGGFFESLFGGDDSGSDASDLFGGFGGSDDGGIFGDFGDFGDFDIFGD